MTTIILNYIIRVDGPQNGTTSPRYEQAQKVLQSVGVLQILKAVFAFSASWSWSSPEPETAGCPATQWNGQWNSRTWRETVSQHLSLASNGRADRTILDLVVCIKELLGKGQFSQYSTHCFTVLKARLHVLCFCFSQSVATKGWKNKCAFC